MRTRRLAPLTGAFLAACASGLSAPVAENALGPLAGTSWQLVGFRSSDDGIGTIRPTDPTAYTMTLGDDGRVALRLDCNRGTGSWTASPSVGGDSGAFGLGPIGMTKVYCGSASMDQRIARDAEYVRTFLLRDGRLYLDLMADAGTYAWEPAPAPR